MAESAGKINIGIKMDFSGLRAQMKRVESVIQKSVERIKRAFSTMAGHAKKALLGIGAVVTAVAFLSIRAAMKQEDALFALQAALSNTGDASISAMNDFKKFAAEIQEVTIFGDEETLALMALQKNLGVATKDLKKATKMTIGLAAATGRNAETMATYVAMALQGETTMLRRYIPALRKTTDQTKQLEIITKFAANGFRVAEARARTTSGGLKQLWNAIGDLAEAFGEPLLGPIKKATKAIKDFVTNSTERLQKFTRFLATAFELKLEVNEGNLFKTIKEFVSLFWEIMKIKTVEWSKNIFDLLVPVFERLGFIVGDAITSAIPRKFRGDTAGDFKQTIELNRQRIRRIQDDPIGVATDAMLQLPRGRLKRDMQAQINDYAKALKSGNDKAIAFFKERDDLVIAGLKEQIRLAEIGVQQNTRVFTSWETQMEKIKARTKKANKEVKVLFDTFLEGTEAAAEAARKAAAEAARIAAEAKKNAVTAEDVKTTFTSSGQAELSRLYKGVTSAGMAVALTGQELFGAGGSRLSADAKYMGGKIIEVKIAVEKQTTEKNRLENIDIGAENIPTPAF